MSGRLSSMTGSARAGGQSEGHAWVIELRSVNHRGLDLRLRLHPALEGLEPELRARIAARIQRGSISVAASLTSEATGARLTIDRAFLQQILDLARELEAAGGERVGLGSLLGVRGVVVEEQARPAPPDLSQPVLASLDQALDRLVAARLAEGARLGEVLLQRIQAIEALVAEAEGSAAVQPAAIGAALHRRVAEILAAAAASAPSGRAEGPGPDPARLEQELAVLALRHDVREELDRLTAHCAAARAALQSGEPVGRALDFLAQEFMREANTLAAKSAALDLTRVALALKTEIERFREQVQNVE